MLVRDRMTAPPITMDVKGSIMEAHSLMRHFGIRRIPILQKNRLVGIVTWTDIMRAMPSAATSLGAWEIPGLLLKAGVKDIMTDDPLTISPDEPIEDAAMIMRQKKVGGLPVMENEALVGMITESDIFNAFIDLSGVRAGGTRLVVDLTRGTQSVAEIVGIVEAAGVPLASMATYTENGRRLAILRVVVRDALHAVTALRARGLRVLYPAGAGSPNGSRAHEPTVRRAWPF